MEIFKFGETLKGKLETIKSRFKVSDITDMGFTFPSSARSLNTDTSFYRIARLILGKEDRRINIATKGNQFMAELVEEGNVKQYAWFDANSFEIKACELNEAGALIPYDESSHGGSIIKAILLEGVMNFRNKAYKNCHETLMNLSAYDSDADEFDDGILIDDLAKSMCGITNYLYYLLRDKTGSTNVTIGKVKYAQITSFREAFVISGKPTFVKKESEDEKTSSDKVIIGEYALDPERVFSKLEESMIPKMPETYVCPPEAKTIPRDIKASAVFSEPYRNILLFGDSGGGKTTLAKAIASELKLPYVVYSCGPDTDSFDTMGGIQPTTEKVKPEELHKKFDIPTFDDVCNDYENVFTKLFGKAPTKLNDPSECYEEITKRLMEASSMCEDFTYVPSNIILAAMNGWVCEIQEATIIKRESELVVLNSLLENVAGNIITLPNGKTIRKHKDAVFCFTSNMNYKGCRSLQESVLSRINIRREIKSPDVEILAERAIAQCKTDKSFEMPLLPRTVVTKMASISKEIESYCKDHDITDGVCGPRELNDWCKKSIMTAKFWGNAEVTEEIAIKCCWSVFLEKISQIPEEVEEIVTAIISKYYPSEFIEEGRMLYENGEI